MTAATLERSADLEAASQRAAELARSALAQAVTQRGFASLALSGGSTPARFFALLAGAALPWEHIHVFWADERLAAPDSPDSNFRLARESLLSRVPLAADNIHPVRGPGWPEPGAPKTAREAARAYESQLRAFFGAAPVPAFDVIHLGLGNDGHTASLFPGQPALAEKTRLALPVAYHGAKPPIERVTLTLPVLNAARLVFFLVSGEDKLQLAQKIAQGRGGEYPAALVRPAGRLFWLCG